MSELADRINQLPPEEKVKYVLRVKEEIKKRGIEIKFPYNQAD